MPPLPPSPFDGAIDRRKRDGSLFRVLQGLLPYVWPSQRPDLRRRIYLAFALMIAAKLITVCVPFAFKWATDAVSRESHTHAPAGHELLGLLWGPLALTALYGGLRIAMGFFHAGARRAVRRGRDERRAPPRAGGVRPPARALAALPPRAQDRRPDPRAGAGPQRDRDDRAHDHAHRGADGHRVRADPRRAVRAVRRALRRRRLRHDRDLPRLDLRRDELADVDPPLDERERHRRQHQGDRLAAQLRDG